MWSLNYTIIRFIFTQLSLYFDLEDFFFLLNRLMISSVFFILHSEWGEVEES